MTKGLTSFHASELQCVAACRSALQCVAVYAAVEERRMRQGLTSFNANCSQRRSDLRYGVATVSRIDKIIGLFCKRDLQKSCCILQKRPIILSILLTVATPYLDLKIERDSCQFKCLSGTLVYSHDNLFQILGTPVRTCLKCIGTAVKTCSKFWQS